MELFNVINEMEELIESSPKVPMTKRVLVDEDRLLDYLDRIRASLPEELRQAKWVLQERDKVITDSKREAVRMIEDAEKQLEKKAVDSEITRKAQEISEEIRLHSEEIARQIKQGAMDYADELLAGLEDKLNGILGQVQENRSELRGIKND
ncbi:ATPase [Desulfoscipio sp. XC116]|uniref:ATPase n=1 Tax=Desulfoscipio sp. XC116 TaxID=3144975 RepID=UPI00325BAB25